MLERIIDRWVFITDGLDSSDKMMLSVKLECLALYIMENSDPNEDSYLFTLLDKLYRNGYKSLDPKEMAEEFKEWKLNGGGMSLIRELGFLTDPMVEAEVLHLYANEIYPKTHNRDVERLSPLRYISKHKINKNV